ncbi:hypothetical protein RvVAT039_pl09770 (plasmid) [Agrobacterium vitis]|uniref:hypothetical protein n=1 Tax=Agrobacterium vitis TaxID=373 RepID=UPI00155DBF08|nr:hypothetical protein [Agrobacterium vitis]BCH68144.1 hypothetical protein RvVAT039_pl09770 [Agrobacterium vitis]
MVRSLLSFSKPEFTFYLHVVEIAYKAKPIELSSLNIGGSICHQSETYPHLLKRQHGRHCLVYELDARASRSCKEVAERSPLVLRSESGYASPSLRCHNFTGLVDPAERSKANFFRLLG